jgi:AhpD family alkylhydroperoxidase
MNWMNLKAAVLTVLVVAALAPVATRAESTRSPEAQAALADVRKTLGVELALVSNMPDANVAPFWEQLKSLQLNPKTALSGKTKELIGLGVAAQVPCRYCVHAHTEFAKLNGASDAALKEAVATAGLARDLSALSHGPAADAKSAMAGPELAAIQQDVTKVFGTVPDFLKRYPAVALPSLWKQMKAVLFNPAGALSVKEKALISLAVAAQLPSDGCVKDYTAMARANQATEQEIQEAVAMAGFTRLASTQMNGTMPDEAQWRRDIKAILKHVAAASATTTRSSAR